ncbi:5'/3'-nucleotidase SurE [Pendulispora albinea]|uniref:5'-nucleotidase SurE n=1 Tax=Pendulispora albinea TaxID=2741071 RepID=A0ABZ2M1F6_9BACT
MTRPLIVLANDDGYSSRGIRTMRDALLEIGDVVLIAPESEQSASSHALTLHRPLRLRMVEEGIFAVDGTPADCIYVALHAGGRVLPRRPDLVVSGLNHGLNLGQDVFYSGTVAAAREGALQGIPALATSAHTQADFAAASRLCARLALGLHQACSGRKHASKAVMTSGARQVAEPAPLLSVNVPRDWNGKVEPARLGMRIYEELVDFRQDPRGREYFWLGGPGVTHEQSPGTDTDAFDRGYATLTALMLDLTDTTRGTLTSTLARDAGADRTTGSAGEDQVDS